MPTRAYAALAETPRALADGLKLFLDTLP